MIEDFRGLYDVRDGRITDKNFVLATFLRSLYYGESFFSKIPKDLFMERYHKVAEALVDSPIVSMKVACLREDQDVILGYSILSVDFQTVYFVFVKKAWRKRGIATSLVPNSPTYVAHLTKLGESLLNKFKTEVKFNPFF